MQIKTSKEFCIKIYSQKIFFSLLEKIEKLVVKLNIERIAERSEAQSAERSFASKIKIYDYWRETSLHTFSFALQAIFSPIISENFLVALSTGVNCIYL